MNATFALDASPVALHTETTDDIDPVTFEVIRNKLWNINIEHGNTILRASGGPIVVYGHDFNPAILTEDAEFVFYGPYIQFLASAQDLMVKWTLAHRAENPGIHDGDMFISNDPFVGATHQNDAALLCPVFVDDKIFCWVTNSVHQTDVGGNTPGSFCADAPDIYHEPTPIQPIKIVEHGEVRSDIHDIYLRQSRTPHLLALDLRAGMSGNNVAKQAILALVDRYGVELVKGVMRRIISHAEEVVRERLERLPDGTYRDRRYVECALPGDRGTYELGFAMHKRGSTLRITNEGSAPQTGALNCSLGGWRSGIINALAIAFCTDLYYAIGGLIRCLEIDAEPRTICTAEYPASVSNGPNAIIMAELGQIGNTLGRMLISDETQRDKIFTSAGMNGASVDGMHAVDHRGTMWASINFEMMSGAIGAFATKDGVPSGGLIFDLKGRAPDVEHLEHAGPILYLYRREYADSAGVGRWARGNSVGAAFVPYGTDAVYHNPSGVGVGVPLSTGLFGGYPANTNTLNQMVGTNVHQRIAAGEIPSDLSELDGALRRLPPRASGIEQGPNDVHLFLQSAGAGYGDPLLREPERVAEDVALGYVTPAMALELYGVVRAVDGSADPEATNRRRAEIRTERLGGRAPVALSERDGRRLTETLIIEGKRVVCRMCGTDCGDVRANYKDGLVRRDLPVTAAGPLICPPEEHVDTPFEFRQFACPGCGTLAETEIARAGDPVLRDIELLESTEVI